MTKNETLEKNERWLSTRLSKKNPRPQDFCKIQAWVTQNRKSVPKSKESRTKRRIKLRPLLSRVSGENYNFVSNLWVFPGFVMRLSAKPEWLKIRNVVFDSGVASYTGYFPGSGLFSRSYAAFFLKTNLAPSRP